MESPIIRVSTSPVYLIPVRVIEGNLMVLSKPFKPGTAMLIMSPVKVSLVLDFLVIAAPH